ncbi:LTA synthase family protein [Pedobacter gandavensis]|uniref:Sulfatase-like hydrolase/transferase n=1 Tax=Pedobacter gandavensis TaxID=2679963 RepID=A0ABR6ER32_9SPHI|nr:alkaline phosphatase family protein [Pedobacter gandavensis]MBB2147728.1 sulfatase-like hydrolase/transferase [Pedobacter gandavensis]
MSLSFLFKSRYSVLFSYVATFIAGSFLIRLGLMVATLEKTNFTVLSILRILGQGLVYDFGVAMFLVLFYALYLCFLPQRWIKSWFNVFLSYSVLFLMTVIAMFSFFAELTFWQEFESRFNFIAVDYLVYTYEVIHNINESYPLPLLIGGVVLISLLLLFGFVKLGAFKIHFQSDTSFKKRGVISSMILLTCLFYGFFVPNSWAEEGANRYHNELAKAGIYSIFSAFKNNELNYNHFYKMLDEPEAYRIIRSSLQENNSLFLAPGASIKREISGNGTPYKPNVIMITVESLSADFMAHFGNKEGLTPILDSLADTNLLFTNMYSTGTRTVRGMEALSLAIPPTPGSSIVRRPNNDSLTTIGNIFEKAGYHRSFYYGGDGYFDNMNQYFGSNGYDIIDRGRKVMAGDNYLTKRTIITDDQVHFENAWGISDEDLYSAVINGSDRQFKEGKPFYSFVMTTSNHRPFTYPSGEIDIPSGTGRNGALRYTDYAIGKFLRVASTKPWFKNTVVIIVADHCASSAGTNEIDISKYHIPCIVLNLPVDKLKSQKLKGSANLLGKMDLSAAKGNEITPLCSQIDLYPTLFNLMGWSYESNIFGKDVLDKSYVPRTFLGTYQKLAYLKKDSLVILSPQQKVETYRYNQQKNEQIPKNFSGNVVKEAIANYQTAYDLFKNGGLHQ